jgi:hypothetical protein
MITFENDLQIIGAALQSLINDEFDSIPVINDPEFNPSHLAKRGRYIRYFYDSDEVVSNDTNGQTRVYKFKIELNFKRDPEAGRWFEKTASPDVERLTKLLQQNITYYPGGVYKWHSAKMESRSFEMIKNENEEISGYRITLVYSINRRGDY